MQKRLLIYGDEAANFPDHKRFIYIYNTENENLFVKGWVIDEFVFVYKDEKIKFPYIRRGKGKTKVLDIYLSESPAIDYSLDVFDKHEVPIGRLWLLIERVYGGNIMQLIKIKPWKIFNSHGDEEQLTKHTYFLPVIRPELIKELKKKGETIEIT